MLLWVLLVLLVLLLVDVVVVVVGGGGVVVDVAVVVVGGGVVGVVHLLVYWWSKRERKCSTMLFCEISIIEKDGDETNSAELPGFLGNHFAWCFRVLQRSLNLIAAIAAFVFVLLVILALIFQRNFCITVFDSARGHAF